MKKLLKWTALLLLAVVALGLVARNFIIKATAKKVVRQTLGVEMDIGSLNVALFDSDVRIEDLKVYSPEGFGKEPLAEVPLIHVDYEAGSMLKGKPHCTLVELDIHDVEVVRNAAGDLNLSKLKALQKGDGDKPAEGGSPSEEGKPVEMRIDKLVLTLHQVTYTTLDADGSVKSQQVYQTGMDKEVFEDLQSPKEIAQLVALRAAKAVGMKLAVYGIRMGLSRMGDKAMEGLKSMGGGFLEGAKGLLGKLNPFGGDKKD